MSGTENVPGETSASLRGQVALVTGAGRGLGRLLALRLAEEGMAVGLVGRDRRSLDDTAGACARHGPGTVVALADVRCPKETRQAVRDVQTALGPVDLLVNNAGLVDRGELPFWEADPDHWWDVYETNVRGTVNACRAIAPEMVRRRSGRIVNVNSILAVRTDPRYSAYSGSKAALLALTGVLADSLHAHGVRLFDLSPGMVRTDMTLGMAICDGREDWTDPARFLAAAVRLARGELDPLAGRFLHAGTDDLDALLAAADRMRADGARTLRLRAHGPADPAG
ncbi:SDR family NAD(P)-dependent oxidoreductase [Streptomyces fenghuangensis]|uniref:SDR family NAD(P)-dependent oxidoreductase n=1 Tax=Streptomyces sp. ICN903 TaxID=2964654 RepID=UPI001EDC5770|nr:SDR family NAD(P)-dependent oxidoreductase [Streptomyces sp. ICN903]MCG3039532.1 SDR family NAD(P)-dependent oxidoreductase [Streptomyces sp. ICN903]